MVEGGWQPIETAPKDGTRVDLWGTIGDGDGGTWEGRFPDCYWDLANRGRLSECEMWFDDSDCGMSPTGRYAFTPTYWMVPPEPPVRR